MIGSISTHYGSLFVNAINSDGNLPSNLFVDKLEICYQTFFASGDGSPRR